MNRWSGMPPLVRRVRGRAPITTGLKAEFAQQYRDQIRKHTSAAMRKKAEAGQVTGGRVFGYDNVRIAPGHTTRVINKTEAAIVVDIYERCASGEGVLTIAAALNRAGVRSPRSQQGRPNGWSQSTIVAVLGRSLYRGEVVYGKTAWAYGRELGTGATREAGQIDTDESTVRLRAAAVKRSAQVFSFGRTPGFVSACCGHHRGGSDKVTLRKGTTGSRLEVVLKCRGAVCVCECGERNKRPGSKMSGVLGTAAIVHG